MSRTTSTESETVFSVPHLPEGAAVTLSRGTSAAAATVEDTPARDDGLTNERFEELLRIVALGVSATTGEMFFRSLVQCLTQALGANYVFIGERFSEDSQRVRTIVSCVDGQILPNFEYNLTGTPCAVVLNESCCSYPSGVQTLFPNDQELTDLGIEGYVGTPLLDSTGQAIGLIVAMFRQPIQEISIAKSLIQVFAVRAAAELERQRSEAALRRAYDEMEERVNRRTAELERERARMEAVLREMPAGVIIVDAQTGRFLLTNAQVSRIWRMPPEKLASLDMLKQLTRFHPDGRPVATDEIPTIRSMKKGEVIQDEEMVIVRGDGTRATVQISSAPVEDRDGKRIAVVSTLKDITDLKNTEEALRRLHNELEMQVQERTAELAQANRALLAEVRERKRAEQVSRGQTSALTHVLQALTAQTEVDTVLEHVLRAIREQLQADRMSVMLYDPTQGTLGVRLAYVGDQRIDDQELLADGLPVSLPAERSSVWRELFRNRRPFVCHNLQSDPRLELGPQFAAQGVKTVFVIPLMIGEELGGWFSIFRNDVYHYRPEEIDLAQALAQLATLALQTERLAAHGQEAAILQERNRIAREIHDTLAQGFAGIIIQVQMAEAAMKKVPEKALPPLIRARDLAKESLAEARRSVWALRPNVLEGSTLPDAFRRLSTSITSGTSLQPVFEVLGPPRHLPTDIENHLLRIGQEALSNTIKYAQASEVRITLQFEPGLVSLTIRDNGAGFDLAAQPRGSGFGHVGMRERIAALRGTLSIHSEKGQGTEVSVSVPIFEAPGEEGPQG